MEILLICVVDAVRWNVVADYCKKEVGERSFGLDLFLSFLRIVILRNV